MKALIVFLVWCILFVLSWPMALLALALLPLIWLLSLPFRLLGMATTALLALVKTLLYLPARLLGHRG